ncbi:5-carboxymethyl-2-hydroxymuconate Delta-isomerase [Photobacterium leiognathi]|uniref:5-carboxymethyl-2-hydroxymuconate Delta-isomerase n=1 Tax=Photobacterium leiognathi TaxID=553611 RepID=UPI00076A90AF|nr:5-carboxymethyl-2-hydroxymuconate Delta-isomerase [Photobacterium leiognathi]
MPHCIIEYAKDLETDININELMATTHYATFSSGLFDEEDIKTRAIPFEFYRTGTTEKPFVHITVRVLPGRDPKQKDNLAEVILHQVAAMSHNDICVTVEIEDINQESYRKYVI